MNNLESEQLVSKSNSGEEVTETDTSNEKRESVEQLENILKGPSRVHFSEVRYITVVIFLVVILIALIIAFFAAILLTETGGESLPYLDTCYTKDCLEVAAMLTSYQNLSAKPCEDFYEHACGGFHDPESFLFENNARFQKTVINRVYDVVRKTSDFASRPKQLLKIFVDKCAEWKADNSDFKDLLTDIEMQGGFPLVNKNWDEQTFDFSDALAERFQKNPNTVSFLSVKRHIVFVSGKQENRLLLSPGPHWYHSQPNHRLELFKDKIGYIIYRLATFSNKLLNQAEYDIEFKKLVELEANLIKFASKNDTPESLISVDELEDLVPEVNWVGILSKMTNNSFNGRELKQKTSVLNQDNFFAKYGTLSRLINETPKRVLANYLVARQLVDFSFFLPYQHSTCADQMSTLFPLICQNVLLDLMEPRSSDNLRIAHEMFESLKSTFWSFVNDSTQLELGVKQSTLEKLAGLTVNFDQSSHLEGIYASLNFLKTDTLYQLYRKVWRHQTEQLCENIVFDSDLNVKTLQRPMIYDEFPKQLTNSPLLFIYLNLDTHFPASHIFGSLGYTLAREIAGSIGLDRLEFGFRTNNSVMQNNLAEKFSLIIAFKAFQKVGKLDKFRLPGYRRINNVQQFFYSFAMGICTDGREPRIKEWVNANLRELPDFATAFECSTVLK